jgi:pimeloyl-ACP methyl ester carboxylesterase
VRTGVYLLIALIVSAPAPLPGQSRETESAAQGHPTAPAFDPELTNYQYPSPARFYELDTQGQRLRMAYMDVAAPRPNGRAAVLLHGKNFSGAYWAPAIRALTEAGYRVVAPDQIGFGKSSKPASYQFTFQALSANTRALLDFIGDL